MAAKKRRKPAKRVTSKKTIHLTITKIKGGRISVTETHPAAKKARKKPAKRRKKPAKRRKKRLPPAPF
jgi:hypothetical protein